MLCWQIAQGALSALIRLSQEQQLSAPCAHSRLLTPGAARMNGCRSHGGWEGSGGLRRGVMEAALPPMLMFQSEKGAGAW